MARPQEYNREDVLKSAMEVFRRQGYGATSIPNLVDATGLQPGSLYAAFGNKKGLLMEALESYSQQNLADMDASLTAHDSALESLFGFLQQTSKTCSSESGEHGCLIMNTFLEMSSQDEDVCALLQKLISNIELRLTAQTKLAVEQGEISNDQDPEALAKFVLNSIWGLRIMGMRQKNTDTKVVVKQLIAHLKSCQPML